MSLSAVVRLVSLLSLATAAQSVQNTTVSGGCPAYLVDLYCYGLAQGGSRAIDGTDVLREPWTHTLHCLRDPSQCRNGGYYVAVRKPNGEYGIQFTFDDAGNTAVLALLDTDGRDDTADGNFLITAVGVHNSDGVLRGAEIAPCLAGRQICDSVCEGNCLVVAQDFELAPSRLLVAHVVFMMLGWGFLLPLGVVWARGLRQSKAQVKDVPLWFAGHRLIQSLGWLLQLIGFACIVAAKEDGGGELAVHFSQRHEVLGLIVVILGSLQPLNAQLRHLSCVGHPSDDGSRTPARAAWEWLHKGQGYLVLLLAIINIILGIAYASDLSLGEGLVPGTIAGTAVSLGGLLLLVIILEARRLLLLPSDEAKTLSAGSVAGADVVGQPATSDPEG